jgi:hypothetical protein
VRALGKQSASEYSARRAAYDLKKLRGKNMVRRIGKTRRYESLPKELRAMTALVVLRNKAIKPLLAAAQQLRPSRGAQNPWFEGGLSISPFERSRWRLRRTRELWEKLPAFAFCWARRWMVSVWWRGAFGELARTGGVGKKWLQAGDEERRATAA